MLPRLIFLHLLGAWLLLSLFPGELRAQMIDDVPTKLCGRDFVRAVIHICGRPRGKKISVLQRPLPQERELEQEPEQMFVSSDNDVENEKLDPKVIPGWKEQQIRQHHIPQNPDSNLINKMYGPYYISYQCCFNYCKRSDIARLC